MKKTPTPLKVERVVPNALLKKYAALPPKLISRSENAIHLREAVLFAASLLIACETSNYVPPVTPAMTSASLRRQHADTAELERGRTLFVHRCIECHTLPPIWKYSRDDWPQIVNDMSHRANLKSEDREAVIVYILAVRNQM